MPRIVAIITAMVWLLVLLISFAAAGPHGAISFDSPAALIGDSIVVAIIGIVAASVWFACRPRRWIAVLLLIVSAVPAALLINTLWSHISFYRTFPVQFQEAFRLEGPWICGAVIFVAVAVLWAVISWRLRDVHPET